MEKNSNMKQTAVEFLEKIFYTNAEATGINNNKWLIDEIDLDNIFEQAKEIQKQQMIDAYERGDKYKTEIAGEQYYQETFGSKGSDTLKDYHIVDTNEMIKDDDVQKLALVIDNLLSYYTDDAPVSYLKSDYKKHLQSL
jgi:hypothetical protein